MYISAFVHRDELFDITNRWFSNDLSPRDPLRITKIITYDSFAGWEISLRFAHILMTSLARGSVHRIQLSHKKDLKDFICSACGQLHPSKASLVNSYLSNPDFYYVGSPMFGYLYHDSSGKLVGISRFKRVKRIAEKASRYAAMYMYKEVMSLVEEAASERNPNAKRTDKTPNHILLRAEQQMMSEIRRNGLKLPKDVMTIKDVLGIKVVDTGFGESALEQTIRKLGGATIIDKERHEGTYNAVHYIVQLGLDMDYVLYRFKNSKDLAGYKQRGLPDTSIEKDFAHFVQSGADAVELDLILTTFDELVESEIGRSMHESRIFSQRQRQGFYGNIPVNIEYIIEFLLAVALSPSVHLDEIPIKLWGRYLPDTLSYRIRKLYRMPEHSLIDL